MRVNQDLEIWLMFLPFWLLGTVAVLAAAWHGVHFLFVHRRAATPDGRHHLTRTYIALVALAGIVGLTLVWAIVRALMRA